MAFFMFVFSYSGQLKSQSDSLVHLPGGSPVPKIVGPAQCGGYSESYDEVKTRFPPVSRHALVRSEQQSVPQAILKLPAVGPIP